MIMTVLGHAGIGKKTSLIPKKVGEKSYLWG